MQITNHYTIGIQPDQPVIGNNKLRDLTAVKNRQAYTSLVPPVCQVNDVEDRVIEKEFILVIIGLQRR